MFIHKPSSFDKGDYAFSGYKLTTHEINMLLSEEEIQSIHLQLADYIKKHGASDYVQVFENENGVTVYAVDNLSLQDMDALREADYIEDHIVAQNYYTLTLEVGQ